MDAKTCPKCGARFLEGTLFWSTGKPGKLEDLAGLVCDEYGDHTCINELKGTKHGGDTWEKRDAYSRGLFDGSMSVMKQFQGDK